MYILMKQMRRATRQEQKLNHTLSKALATEQRIGSATALYAHLLASR